MSEEFAPDSEDFLTPETTPDMTPVNDARLSREYDSVKYQNLLAEAQIADLSEVWRTSSVGVGQDDGGRPCIYFIPALALKLISSSLSEVQLYHKMFLLFVKSADSLSESPFSIVYGSSALSWLREGTLNKEYHNLLPARYHKNITALYILHPDVGAHVVFRLAKFYIGQSFYKKLHFVKTISALQAIISPFSLKFPAEYLQWEEINIKNSKCSRHLASGLIELYDIHLEAPVLLIRCISFLKACGLKKEGLFRIPGLPIHRIFSYFLFLFLNRIIYKIL